MVKNVEEFTMAVVGDEDGKPVEWRPQGLLNGNSDLFEFVMKSIRRSDFFSAAEQNPPGQGAQEQDQRNPVVGGQTTNT